MSGELVVKAMTFGYLTKSLLLSLAHLIHLPLLRCGVCKGGKCQKPKLDNRFKVLFQKHNIKIEKKMTTKQKQMKVAQVVEAIDLNNEDKSLNPLMAIGGSIVNL